MGFIPFQKHYTFSKVLNFGKGLPPCLPSHVVETQALPFGGAFLI